MHHELMICGTGGQGILLIGHLLAHAAMLENKYVTWLPYYGPEKRGGEVNCSIVVSDEEVGSPIITAPNEMIAMDLSKGKVEELASPNACFFYNESMKNREFTRNDLEFIPIDANAAAKKIGNIKVANLVILGAFIAKTEIVYLDSVIAAMEEMFKGKSDKVLNMNKEALLMGRELMLSPKA